MKFRIIFVRKKFIYFLLFSFFILLFILLVNPLKKTTQTLSIANNRQTIKYDITGDNKEDIIYIKEENYNYYVQVNINGQNYNLEPSIKVNTIGKYTENWPLKITFMDITGDKRPEIFIQGTSGENSILNVFMWEQNNFRNIYSSNDNIFGVINLEENYGSVFFSGTLNSKSPKLSNYIFIKNDLEEININDLNTTSGINTIKTFINFIEGLPHSYLEKDNSNDLFHPQIDESSLSIINNLTLAKNKLTFRDGFFTKESGWTLYFKAMSDSNSVKEKIYELKLSMVPYIDKNNNMHHKVKSIILK